MNNLETILIELNQYKNKQDKLMYNYINERLTKSLISYYKELQTTVNFLNSKKDKIVLDGINNE